MNPLLLTFYALCSFSTFVHIVSANTGTSGTSESQGANSVEVTINGEPSVYRLSVPPDGQVAHVELTSANGDGDDDDETPRASARDIESVRVSSNVRARCFFWRSDSIGDNLALIVNRDPVDQFISPRF